MTEPGSIPHAACMPTRRDLLGGVLLALLGGPAAALATQPDAARVYFFGNSLIHHLTASDATTVPYWLAALALRDGADFRSDGRWGFPRNFAAELPPGADWSVRLVRRVTALGRPINAASYDTFVLVPENFVQYGTPDRLYGDSNPERQSPLSAIEAVMDWVFEANPGARFLIYEGWADMHPFSRGFPPGARGLRRHANHARGEYHRWYVALTEALRQARPDHAIGMIPVGRTLVDLLASPELSGIEVEDLYSDLSPHGTATIYLLAAMITYSAIYDRPPPLGFVPADGVSPALAENWDRVVARVWEAHQARADY